MEDFDDALLPEERKGASKVGVIITSALVVLCLFIGLIALYFAYQARTELVEFQNELKAKPDQTIELRAELEKLNKSILNVGAETVRNKRKADADRDRSRKANDELRRGVSRNRQRIEDFDGQVARIATNVVDEPKSSREILPAEIAIGEVESGEKSQADYHIVQPGDNFGKLADQYETTIDAFFRANPGVNPRRLQIGQKLKITE